MRAHLNAIREVLELVLDVPAFLIDATGVTEARYVIVSPGYRRVGETGLDAATGALNTEVRVTSVADTADGCLIIVENARRRLSPNMGWGLLPVDGRGAETRWERLEVPAQADRDITLPGTNRHPVYQVDTYRLVSEPLA